jgi:hypothetical protein
MQSTPFTSHLQAQIYTDPVPMVPRPAPLPESKSSFYLYYSIFITNHSSFD